MESGAAPAVVAPYFASGTHEGSIAALGPDARAFFAAHGYSLARLARRNRVSPEMMGALFAGRTTSRRLIRNLRKLRAQLETPVEGDR